MQRRLLWMSMLLGLVYSGIIAQAQDKVVLTLSVPQWTQDSYNQDYLAPFLEANPGVDVVIVPDTDGKAYPSSPAYVTLEEHLEAVESYVTSADVLQANNWSISPESTAAGFWLDVAPLVAADPDLDEANFYPPAWHAFRWDRGMWALPTTIEPEILMYDPEAFDAAGLTYPAANWTMDQYTEAASTLAQRDQKGNLTNTGCWCDTDLMYYGMLGHGLADSDGNPMLEDPALAAMIETWAAARDDIYPQGGYSSQDVPILMMAPWALAPGLPSAAAASYVVGELPGGIYGANVTGFGISAGTLHPELAFNLAKYLAETPLSSGGGFTTFPALRQSEVEQPENYVTTSLDDLSSENQQILLDALETAVTGTDFRYFTYINQAVNQIRDENTDAMIALQQAQQTALENRAAAADWQNSAQPLVVATAIPTPTFGADEIALNFGVSQYTLQNPQDWDRIGREFAESDPEVGVVNVHAQGNDYQSWQMDNECFYLSYSSVNTATPDQYLPLDPLMDADPNFDPTDFVPGALEAMQYEGQTYAYPLTIGVSALRYDPKTFEQAGVPLPDMNWSISDFVDALNQLAANEEAEYVVPFAPRGFQNTDWLLLIAAYGALPIDYRVDPPTANFTDPDTVDAIRQVLDLAKAGLIDYQKMGTFYFSGMQRSGALTAVDLGGDSYPSFLSGASYVNYPHGSDFQLMSLGSIGGGYVRSDALHPEACYRWIKWIDSHPEVLTNVMPARLSLIDDPATEAAQGEAAVALYRQYAALAADPSTLNIPANPNSLGSFMIGQFLNRAFDAYVLEDADLEQALADAQRKADDFPACYNAIPEPGENPTEDEIRAYSDATEQCIALVDPEMAAERAELMQSVP